MSVKKKGIRMILIILLILMAGFLIWWAVWNVFRRNSPEEDALRQKVVETAESYLGCNEADGSHQQIIDLYNSHQPLARDYEVTYTDSWCAAFVSAVSIQCGLTDMIPTECSCQQMIALFDQMGCWEESDGYFPEPGDIIFYAWDDQLWGDCTGWADHVGIVVDTIGPVIKVIEGNRDDAVAYRYVPINYPTIRGYGLPDYQKLS